MDAGDRLPEDARALKRRASFNAMNDRRSCG
jgi:hypothetical protein